MARPPLTRRGVSPHCSVRQYEAVVAKLIASSEEAAKESLFDLSHYILRIFVFAEGHEPRMPQMPFRRPFGKLEVSDEHGFQPAAILHLFFRQPLSPSTAVFFR